MSKKLVKVGSNGTDLSKQLVILRPSKLEELGKTGTIAAGIYIGSSPNKFDADKLDFRINGSEFDYIINETATLRSKLEQVSEGSYVEVVYNGKQKSKSGKMYHSFDVLVEQE